MKLSFVIRLLHHYISKICIWETDTELFLLPVVLLVPACSSNQFCIHFIISRWHPSFSLLPCCLQSRYIWIQESLCRSAVWGLTSILKTINNKLPVRFSFQKMHFSLLLQSCNILLCLKTSSIGLQEDLNATDCLQLASWSILLGLWKLLGVDFDFYTAKIQPNFLLSTFLENLFKCGKK